VVKAKEEGKLDNSNAAHVVATEWLMRMEEKISRITSGPTRLRPREMTAMKDGKKGGLRTLRGKRKHNKKGAGGSPKGGRVLATVSGCKNAGRDTAGVPGLLKKRV